MFVSPLNHLRTDSLFGAPYSDPQEGDVIVTTQALPAGRYVCTITIATVELTDSRFIAQIQRRDAEDTDSPVASTTVVVPFDRTEQFAYAVDLEAGENLSVASAENVEGQVYAAITYQRVK